MSRAGVPVASYWRLVCGNRNFRRLWLAQIISEMGDWVYIVAIYTLLLELTHSATSVAIAVVLQVLPQFFVAPTAGVVNDRLSRKRVMISADLARAVIVLGMLFAARAGSVALIYGLLVAETIMWAFFEPGRTAVVPNITRSEDLVVANALSSMTWSINLALGSGAGGAVAAFFGRDVVFVLNSLSFLLSAVLLGGMKFPEPHLVGAGPMRARELVDFSPMAEGLQYVLRHRRILALLLVKAGLGFVGTHWVLLPLFGERVFPVKAARLDPRQSAMLGMSVLLSCRGIGALLGPMIAGLWAGERRARLRVGILIGFLIGAAGNLGLSAAPTLTSAALAVVVAHSGWSIVWVFSTTLLQMETEDRFRGRVFSADFACLVATMSLVTYTSGVLVDHGLGVRALAAATALIALGPAALWASGMRLWRTANIASE